MLFTFAVAFKGTIAQLVEHRTENPGVPGSNPGGTTKKTGNLFKLPVFLFSKIYNHFLLLISD